MQDQNPLQYDADISSVAQELHAKDHFGSGALAESPVALNSNLGTCISHVVEQQDNCKAFHKELIKQPLSWWLCIRQEREDKAVSMQAN